MGETTGHVNNSDFSDYLLAEYQYIAEAHFKTIEAISSFFRYYLIIVGLPFTLYAVIIGLSQQIHDYIYVLTALTAGISIIIALAGLLVTSYIVNLRLDAVLYARTVNGIRKHFYDQSNLDLNYKLRMKMLPQTPSQPGYFEGFFLPAIICFALFDSVYLLLGLSIFFAHFPGFSEITSFSAVGGLLNIIPTWVWVVCTLFFIAHFLVYLITARWRELSYLKSNSIGIDIDGVLNDHRTMFCQVLESCKHIKILPDQILKIPVHENITLGVKDEDEKAVFNEPLYWTDMPVSKNAKETITKLRNGFKLKVFIFTYRHSPSSSIDKELKDQWKAAAFTAYIESNSLIPRYLRYLSKCSWLYKRNVAIAREVFYYRLEFNSGARYGIKPIDVLTKRWLKKAEIPYDVLTIEKGNDDASDPRGHFRNRFFISRQKKIRFFVEDDPDKAMKLSFICEVVFLMKQSYNADVKLPSNVVPVSDWDEVLKKIRQLS